MQIPLTNLALATSLLIIDAVKTPLCGHKDFFPSPDVAMYHKCIYNRITIAENKVKN